MANPVCFRMELQCNSQRRKPRLQRTASMKFFTAKPCCLSTSWCCSLGTCRELHRWRHWPDNLSRCIGDHSQIIYSGCRRDTTRRRPEKLGFCQPHVSRCQMAWRVVVPAEYTSANVQFECSKEVLHSFQTHTGASPYGFG